VKEANMYSLLLIIIYIAFISLGLGDSLLGPAWPTMYGQFGVPVAYAGIISMTMSAGTIASALLIDRLIKKIGTRLIVIFSVVMTAVALFGFSMATSFFMFWVFALPYGFGAGAVDATINNYVAINYKSRHMNWLHCFWGVGAMTGPYIMGFYLIRGFEWTAGYRTIVLFQIVLIAILFASMSLWKKSDAGSTSAPVKPFSQIIRIRGVRYALPALIAYCAIEATTGLWASTYLAVGRGINPEIAAGFASLFYAGITAGRFLSGFVSNRLGSKNMMKIGISLIFVGIAAVLMPTEIAGLIGLMIIGLGCSPIFPAFIHLTPKNFGQENSQALVGLQMASAYVGVALIPPFFGFMAGIFGMGIYPIFILVFAVLLSLLISALNRAVAQIT